MGVSIPRILAPPPLGTQRTDNFSESLEGGGYINLTNITPLLLAKRPRVATVKLSFLKTRKKLKSAIK